MQISFNRTACSRKIEYIVIHDTGNKSKGANASAHFKYFNGGNRNASADFFVDDTGSYKVNDYTKYYTWHCGDGYGRYGITNVNSIGIEICVNADGDYAKAFENAAALTKELMLELNIPINNVVRHYDASRKNCPASMSADNWSKWKVFKKMLKFESPEEVVQALQRRGIITNHALWSAKCIYNSNSYWLAYKVANQTTNHARGAILSSVNDIVWELGHRGIITDKALWLSLLEEDKNLYWLAYKCANMTTNLPS